MFLLYIDVTSKPPYHQSLVVRHLHPRPSENGLEVGIVTIVVCSSIQKGQVIHSFIILGFNNFQHNSLVAYMKVIVIVIVVLFCCFFVFPSKLRSPSFSISVVPGSCVAFSKIIWKFAKNHPPKNTTTTTTTTSTTSETLRHVYCCV